MKTTLSIICLLALAPLATLEAGTQLRIGDSIEIRISGVPGEEQGQINNLYTISSDGTIELPYINPVRAVGLTPSQLARSIRQVYIDNQIYRTPNITVGTQSAPRFVNVGGDVRSPTSVPHRADLTLLSAINAAGGFSEYANQRRVRLIRDNEVMVIDIRKIREDPSQDIPMLPGDFIEVPRSSGIPFFD